MFLSMQTLFVCVVLTVRAVLQGMLILFALALVAAQPPPYYVVIYNGFDGVGTSTCTGTVNTTLTNIFPNQCFPLPTWISPSVPLYIKIAVISNGPPFNVSTTTWADAGCSATMVSSTASIIAKTCRPFAGFPNAFLLNAATLAATFSTLVLFAALLL